MKLIFPIIAVVVAIGLFSGFIDPTYQEAKRLKADEAQFDEALQKSKELRAIRDELQETRKSLSPVDLDRLSKLLPDHIDNVRLVMDIDNMASRYGMRLNKVTVSAPGVSNTAAVGPSGKLYDSVVVNFSVASSYANFRSFLQDLEKSLRLVDVVGLAFNAVKGDFYEYEVSVRTYWLK